MGGSCRRQAPATPQLLPEAKRPTRAGFATCTWLYQSLASPLHVVQDCVQLDAGMAVRDTAFLGELKSVLGGEAVEDVEMKK